MNEINKIWPKWQVEEVLGKGGFGTVYKVKREEFGAVTYSAVKVVKIPNDDSETKEMTSSGMSQAQIKDYYYKNVVSLIDEIKLMETLKSSANIVTIEDFETLENEDGFGWTIFIRMELLTNITNYFSNQANSVNEIVKLGIDICSALEHCHAMNIIHRDIKPDNIFISKFGDYKLGDFGVSRQAEQSMATMSQKGTKSYMAPEMIRMEKYGKNVDLYALALTMYELLNHGRMPFLPTYPNPFYPQDRENAMLKRLTGEVFPEIEGIGRLNAIISKACHKDPTKRYQSATEMKKDLQMYLSEENITEVNDEKTITGLNNETTIDSFDHEKTVGIFHGDMLFEEEEKTVDNRDSKIETIVESEEKIVEQEKSKKGGEKKKNKFLFIIPIVVLLLGAVVVGSMLFGSTSNHNDTNTADPYDYLSAYSTNVYYETMDGIIDITVVPVSQMNDADQPKDFKDHGLFVLEVRSTINETGVDAKIEPYDILSGFDYSYLYTVEQMDALFAIGGAFELEVGKFKYDYARTYICDVNVLEDPLFDPNILGINIMNVNQFDEISADYDESGTEIPLSKAEVDAYLSMFEENYIEDGVVVIDVVENSLAQKYGFMPGDVITVINGNTIISIDDFPEGFFVQHEANQVDSFYVKRQSQDVYIDIVRP